MRTCAGRRRVLPRSDDAQKPIDRRSLLKASVLGSLFVPVATACERDGQDTPDATSPTPTRGEITKADPPTGTRLTLLGTSGGPPPDYGRTRDLIRPDRRGAHLRHRCRTQSRHPVSTRRPRIQVA
jgi:hypothetical protein